MPAKEKMTPQSKESQHNSASHNGVSDVFGDRHVVDDSTSDLIYLTEQRSMTSRRSSRGSAFHDNDAESIAENFADGSILPMTSHLTARNSIRKSRTFLVDPFRNDEDRGSGSSNHNSGLASDTASITGTMTSASDSDLYTREPRRPSNQSNALARTPTMSSTLSRHPTGRQSLHGPAHPYNMYPQTVDHEIIDDDASGATPMQSIPMGFPARLAVTNFRNHADNVSEQLPPYSEYPENGAPKNDDEPAADEETTAANPFADPRPAQSMSDNAQARRGSSESLRDVEPVPPKSWKQKTWREKRRTKFCGIAFGHLVLASGVILFIVTVCSATIGGFFSAQAKDAAAWEAKAKSSIDSAPINVYMPSLPTGAFQLQLGYEQQVESQCLTDQTQVASWNCSIYARGAMALNIQNTTQGQQVAYIYNANPVVTGYGTEVPQTYPASLKLVKDFDAVSWGPAWQFQAVYTKVVYVPVDLLPHQPVASSKSKRHHPLKFEELTQRQWQSSNARAGDQLWKCSWNNTLIEGFIYMRKNATSWYDSKNSTSSSATSTTTQSPTTTWSSGSSTESSKTSSACYWSAGARYNTPTNFADPCPPVRGSDAWSNLPFFPEVIKVEERRLAGDPSRPYCEKKQVLYDDKLGNVNDPVSNQPIVIELSEQSPDWSAQTSEYGTGSKKLRRDDEKPLPFGSCHCQWISGDYTPT